MEEPFLIVIEGGSPWGFSIQGGLDFRSPLKVKTVKAGGRASQSGLVAGDYILEINDQVTKKLKHMQAQQLIKKSVHRVELKCVKLRPGLTSPAVGMSPSFTFPSVANSNPKPVAKSPITKSKPIAKHPPPPVTVNGHTRKSSTGTTSESTTTSSSPRSTIEVYEAKYAGMDTLCIDKSQPMQQQQSDIPIQEPVEAVEVSGEVPIMYDFPTEGEGGIEEAADVVEMSEEVPVVYDFQQEGEAPENVEVEQPGEARVVQDEEAPVNQDDEPPISEPVAAVVLEENEFEIPTVDHEVQLGDPPIVETADAVVFQDSPIEINISERENPIPLYEEAPVVNDDDWEIIEAPPQDKFNEFESECVEFGNNTSLVDSHKTENESQIVVKSSPPINKMDLVNVITSAAKERKRRESSTDSEDTSKGQTSPEKSPQVVQKQSPPKPVTTAAKPPKPVRAAVIETKEDVLPVAKQPLKKTENPVATGTKEPGWYKNMFQDFQNTVEECFPGAQPDDQTYVYDDRGLKVRRDSLPRKTSEETIPKREAAPSPDDPVYEYDDRGLRVRADSLSKVQRSLSPEVEAIKREQRPKSATTKMSVDSGLSTDDVLSANKKQTGYKATQYSTDGSRDYWKQKDQDHQEFEIKRRNSQEQLFHTRQGSSEFSAKMTSMHPLLQSGMDEEKATSEPASDGDLSVLTRIDASKLQGALDNASMLGQLEKEGVPTDLLPAVAKDAQAEKNKPKEKQLKPPPGRKAKALFNFDSQSSKELPFKKGDILDLTHTVDDNWLEGSLGGAKGIFPTAYVQVLSLDEYRAMLSPEPKPREELGQAVALYDFQGNTEKEISFSKDDVLTIEKKIDDNWYQGYHGDLKGIFPVVYVQVLEGSQ